MEACAGPTAGGYGNNPKSARFQTPLLQILQFWAYLKFDSGPIAPQNLELS
jgi:hypothetical protein